MIYSLHTALMRIAEDLMDAIEHNDLSQAKLTVETDLATAYVLAKELETHGYDAFKELINELSAGESQ